MSIPEEEGLRYMIGKLEGKIDALIASLQRQTTDIHEHEQRIRILETSRAWVLGWSSAAAVLVSLIVQYIFKGK